MSPIHSGAQPSSSDERALLNLLLRETKVYGVVFMEPTGEIRGWNSGAEFLTGFTETDVIGKPVSMLFTPEDREQGLDAQELRIAREVGMCEDERWHVRKDGSRVWTSGASSVLRDDAGELTGFVKIFRDATHLRSRMKYLENVLQQCSTQQEQHAYFIGTIAHELRNPLSPLKNSLYILGRHASGQEVFEPPLKVMDRQIGFLERLVEDLVDMTRLRSGKLSVSYSKVVLQHLVDEALGTSRAAADEQGVFLERVVPTVPLEVEVDPDRIVQVLVNLLGNAIKNTPHGGSVWLTITADQTHFLAIVRDTGKGIGPELMPKIFDAFTQVEGAGTARGTGVGLGLAVVKEIVSLHKGTAEARSEGEGKGAEFIIRIPLRKPSGLEPEPIPRPHGSP